MSANLPVFVYGTLRNSCGNYEFFLEGATISEQIAYLPNAAMYTNGGFPYVVFSEDRGQVVGELMYLEEDTYSKTVNGLDGLEGYHGPDSPHNHYDRMVVEVKTAKGESVMAYTYIAAAAILEQVLTLRPVEDGDWDTAKSERFARMA